MKEFVEKLIERLEDVMEELVGWNHHKVDAYSNAIRIVNQLAEEYKQDSTKKNQNKQKFSNEKLDAIMDKILDNQGWIPCSEKLPESEKEVLIMANRKYMGGKILPIITTAIYEDGTMLEKDSIWYWSDIDGEWNEEEECYIIPKGWFEYRHYNPDEVYNNTIDDNVIAWMPLPEPYKPEKNRSSHKQTFMQKGSIR